MSEPELFVAELVVVELVAFWRDVAADVGAGGSELAAVGESPEVSAACVAGIQVALRRCAGQLEALLVREGQL